VFEREEECPEHGRMSVVEELRKRGELVYPQWKEETPTSDVSDVCHAEDIVHSPSTFLTTEPPSWCVYRLFAVFPPTN
jgi:hypothetical protein